jgi:hypothetical protein
VSAEDVVVDIQHLAQNLAVLEASVEYSAAKRLDAQQRLGVVSGNLSRRASAFSVSKAKWEADDKEGSSTYDRAQKAKADQEEAQKKRSASFSFGSGSTFNFVVDVPNIDIDNLASSTTAAAVSAAAAASAASAATAASAAATATSSTTGGTSSSSSSSQDSNTWIPDLVRRVSASFDSLSGGDGGSGNVKSSSSEKKTATTNTLGHDADSFSWDGTVKSTATTGDDDDKAAARKAPSSSSKDEDKVGGNFLTAEELKLVRALEKESFGLAEKMREREESVRMGDSDYEGAEFREAVNNSVMHESASLRPMGAWALLAHHNPQLKANVLNSHDPTAGVIAAEHEHEMVLAICLLFLFFIVLMFFSC